MKGKLGLTWAAPLAALLLLGCEQGLRVDVTQTGGVISFAAARVASSGTVCLRDIRILTVGSGEPRTVWHVAASSGAACIDRITYSRPPAGFTEDTPGAPLAKGQIYSVAVKADSDLSGAQLFVPGAHDGDIGSGSG